MPLRLKSVDAMWLSILPTGAAEVVISADTTIFSLKQPRKSGSSAVPVRWDVFDYIEMFRNPKRKHARNGMLSPVEFERQQKMKQEGV